MRVDNNQLRGFLIDSKFLPGKKIDEVFKSAAREKTDPVSLILEKRLIKEEDLYKILAYMKGVPFVNLETIIIPKEVLGLIPEPIAREHSIVAFRKNGDNLLVALLDPDDFQTLEFIRKKTGLNIITRFATPGGIKNALKQYHKSLEAEFEEIIKESHPAKELKIIGEEKSGAQKTDLENAAEDIPIIKIVDTLLLHAIVEGASDIHIEPEEKDVIVRYRVDGVLRDAMILPKQVQQGIAARIKVLANLKLDEHRLPQDGRFKIEKDDYKIAFRVSTLPIFDGEKVVMRLLNENLKGLNLENLGFWGKSIEAVKKAIGKPSGMILVTGPTGSGKTTTLYSLLEILNTPEVNINTVEDPIEYRMPRVNQTQVSPKIGLTFASGLRALLRQDPDIIMVGEIRDEDTAEMAIHAALTGHLVLSTLHTNSASATLPRLLDMKVEPFLVATTVNVIIAQRLVRKLCPDCRRPYKLGKVETKSIGEKFKIERIIKIINREKISNVKKLEEMDFYHSSGCERCRKEGYKGRVGIYEVLEIGDNLRSCINKGATADQIEQLAVEEGMITIAEDGFIKAIKGITSLEEIMRAVKE
ncbi:Flp pilus assembly complex ATPase component TadA [Patescibacteria group bacterium]|nr:Flp pilus assembly complex ATPase component TadA [Patescibacteria group bacterium]MBU4368725.1 Flp pilus assembly complex ATPase component TadA [Patescibacteria group bacterium]